MKCDKLFKEAFEGIEFRYKLDDTLEGLGNQKLTAKQLEGYLLGKGISPKEIKQSGIFDGMIDDNRALPTDMWLNKSGAQRVQEEGRFGYEDITLSRKGTEPESKYSVTASYVKPTELPTNPPHFGASEYYDKFGDEGTEKTRSLLGWRRTHIDEINGKKTLVLNEFQSDWAQTERAGRGIFESNKPSIREVSMARKLVNNYINSNNVNLDDFVRGKVALPPEVAQANELVEKASKNIVADFPMSEIKHHQFQIVGAINDAIKEGIDTVAIPIQRENELAGSAGVTKFYESLNTKILPDIRKKLEKQGLKIKVDKKPYSSGKGVDLYEALDTFPAFARDNDYASMDTILSKLADFEETNGYFNSLDDLDKFAKEFGYEDLLEDFLSKRTAANDLWTLTIEEVPNGKVKWDVYSVLAALGLGGIATQSEANVATEKDIATKPIETMENQKPIDNTLDLASFLSEIPEQVNPDTYESNYKGIKSYIAKIESRGASNPYNAKSKTSSASGKYQFTNIMVKDLNQKLGITRKDLRSPRVQEQAMEYLIGEYKDALDRFGIPNKKENIFVLHNLGITGGLRALRGTYEPSDIKNMASNLTSDMDKSNRNAVITNYNTLYNVDIPLRSKINKS